MAQQHVATQVIATALRSLHRSVPVSEGELSMIPLLNTTAAKASYLTLDEAITRGGFTVKEVGNSGTVPELRVKNSEASPVLILDGEQILGGKQNRIVNLSLMVPAISEMVIPVTCVERGRWSHRYDPCRPSEHVMYAEARASKMAQVTNSMKHGTTVRHKRADQGAVWSDIDAKSARMRSHSSTDAMETVFSDHKTRLEPFVKRFVPVEHQVGAIFVARGVECGVELFDSVSTWSKFMPQLVRSWAMDAIDDGGGRDVRRRRGKSKDRERLTGQLERVYEAVKGGRWLTLTGIAARTGDPEASISAQLRNLRKPRFGAYDIRKRRAGNRFEYTCAGKQSEDAIDDGGGRDVRRRRERLTDMIERVCSRSWTVSQALGLGWDTRSRSASDENLTAGALLVDDRLVHLAAFERFVRW